jgi:hypothetical protein
LAASKLRSCPNQVLVRRLDHRTLLVVFHDPRAAQTTLERRKWTSVVRAIVHRRTTVGNGTRLLLDGGVRQPKIS